MLKNILNIGIGKAMEFAFIAGIAAGATIGAIAGLATGFVAASLTAPKTGDDTRTELGNKGKEVASNMLRKTDEFIDFATEKDTKSN